MPLRFISEPEAGTSLVETCLRGLSGRSGFGKRLARVHLRVKLPQTAYAPHPVYLLSAAGIASGEGLSAVVPWGFYYVIEDFSGSPHLRAHVLTDSYGNAKVGSVSVSSYSKHTIDALNSLAVHDVVQDGSYEVRALRCKDIFLSTIWLKSDISDTLDLIYPFALKYSPNPMKAKGEPPYLANDFLDLLVPFAQKRIRQNVLRNMSDRRWHQAHAP